MEVPLEGDVQGSPGEESSSKEDRSHGDVGPRKRKRSQSPGPSDVPMESDQRSPSPVSTFVSMKRDQDMDETLHLGAGDSPGIKSIHPDALIMHIQQAHKAHLLEKFKFLMEGLTHQGHSTLLRKIYTDLYITEGGTEEVNKEHEVRQIEKASWREAAQERHLHVQGEKLSGDPEGEHEECEVRKVEKTTCSEAPNTGPIKCKDIFGGAKRTVLTKGVAGIGKTVSVQMFILDWAEGISNQHIDFIFPLPFRELNLMKEETSLVDLIKHFFSDMDDPRVLTSSNNRVMFIFDGLDECRLRLDFHSKSNCCNVTESVTVDVLLTNLIKGKLLPSALLWITTRPAAANQIPPQYVNQVTEIRGFNDLEKEEYFRNKLSDDSLASRTIAHIKSCRSLYIMCHIPIFSWILATVVERTSDGSGSVALPRTLTQMYTHFLIIQVRIKKNKYTEQEERDGEMIYKLGKLAFQQLEKENLIFYEGDLIECGIDVTEASVYSGVCTQIFREEAGRYQGKVFSFVHLSIQEFLAALYVFLRFSNRERNMADHQGNSTLSALFKTVTVDDLHKTAVDLALESFKGHLDLFLRFLLGLSVESNQNLLSHLMAQTGSQSQSSEQTVQLVKQNIRDQTENFFTKADRRINLFYCLNELNQHAVVERRRTGTLYVEMLLPGQWETEEFMFKTSEEYLDGFDLQKYIKTPQMDQTDLLSPHDVLQKLMTSDVFTSSTSAQLGGCPILEKSCSYMTSALTSNSSRLTQLELGSPKILFEPSPVLDVSSSAGCHPDCKPWQLRFRLLHYNLTEEICSYLVAALTSHTSTLSGHRLEEAEGERLYSTLGHEDCRLEEIKLDDCPLSDKSCSYLASALTSHSSSLTDLMLSNNNLQDSAVELFCSALCHPNCRLQTLQLDGCPLSEKSCSHLSFALTSHASCLTKLELWNNNNNLQDLAVEPLCFVLCHPHCKLQTLQLYCCPLSEKSYSYLASALTSHSSNLTHLMLGDHCWDAWIIDRNHSEWEETTSSVRVSSSAGCHLDCKPRVLSLWQCNLTEEICSYLVSALTSHTSTLRGKNMREWIEVGERLCSTLSLQDCRLEKLTLDCTMSEKGCSYLVSVLTSDSSRITQLKLWELQDSGVELLCSALCHLNCKVEKLKLRYCTVSEKSCSYLGSALTSRLTQLLLGKPIHRDFLEEAGSSSLTVSSSAGCHADCKPRKFRLVNDNLTEGICSYLVSALTSHTSTLSGSHMRTEDVELLCSTLSHQDCRLEKLEMSTCQVSEKSYSYLGTALTSHSSRLTQLMLYGPYYEDDEGEPDSNLSSLTVSSSAVCHPDCKPRELRLKRYNVTEEICSYLVSALTSHTSTLSGEHLRKEDVERLCSTLSHQDCRLDKLQMFGCPLSENSCSCLVSALTSHSSHLRKLKLRSNELNISTVEMLCSAVCHPNCKLQTLQLEQCRLSQKSCSYLVSALTSHSSHLTKLKLRNNLLSISKVELLCSAVCHLNCKLQTLQLELCPLSQKSCSYLASTLSSHSSHLTQLMLSDNNMQDLAVELFCSDLCHPKCRLEKLQMFGCPLSEKSCSCLVSALTSHSSHLRKLKLRSNELNISTVEMLCSAVCHPNCKLQTLQLDKCPLSNSSCSYLASALTSHSSHLTQLELEDVSIPDESATEKLTTLQNDPRYQMKIRCYPRGPPKWQLNLSCRVLEKSEGTTTSVHHQQQSQEVSDDNSLKENPAAADTLASTSSSHSSDAAELHATHSSQQHTGAQLPSLRQGRICQTCADIQDPGNWCVLPPSTSLESGECVYTVSSDAGSYECSESGLRWSSAGPVTLQYRISKEEIFWAQLQMLGYRPAGPLLEIKLLSGELEEVHLPHSLCLGGADPAVLGDAVRALHGDDSGVSLETCELRRFHGRLSTQHFSLRQLLVWLGFPLREHYEVLIYKHNPQPLILHIYLLPLHSSKQALQEQYQERGAPNIIKPHPNISVLTGSSLKLHTSCSSVVSPPEVTCNTDSRPSFEVCVKEPPEEFKMKLRSPEERGEENQPVWNVTMWQDSDYHRTPHHDDSQTRVTDSQIETADITEQQLMKVAKLMGREWKQVGIGYLGLSVQELDKIQESEQDVTMQRFRMLDQWRRQNKGKAGVSELHRCLDEDDVPNAVRDCLEGMLQGTSNN